jgi:hypothetical protein
MRAFIFVFHVRAYVCKYVHIYTVTYAFAAGCHVQGLIFADTLNREIVEYFVYCLDATGCRIFDI